MSEARRSARPRRARGLAVLALALALPFAPGCKKSADKPDTGVLAPSIVADDDLGFRLELQPDWVLARSAEATDASAPLDARTAPVVHTGVERLAEARRIPPKGRTYLVQPKLVITSEPTTQPDLESVVRTTASDLRGLERVGARVGRSAQATRLVGDVEVGDLELAYTIGEKDAAKEIVHRTLVALRTRADGTSAVWALTVTCLADDAEQITADVQQVLATLRFTPRAAEKAGAPDGGSR